MKGYPRRPALGHQHPEVRVPVQGARCDELDHRALAAERRLGVVEHGAARAVVGHPDAVARGEIDWLAADVEGDHHADVFRGGPERLPLVAVVVALRRMRLHRQEDRLESHCAATLELIDRVADVQCGDLCRGDQPRRVVHDRLFGPVVGGAHGRLHQLRCAKRAGPHAQRREHQLRPDAFGVEIGQPLADVACARGGHRGVHELLLGRAGQPTAKDLAVDVNGLPGAVRVLYATRHQFGQSLRQP